MHIEPGFVSSAKIFAANATAIALLASQGAHLIRRPPLIVRTVLASIFFSIFMQLFHVPAGPSELHFVGAMPIYLARGFIPTLFGFALGPLLQGLLFNPADLVHLGVNALSLIVPLCMVHATLGRRLQNLDVRTIIKLDAAYYSGVTLMVGFWLAIGEVATPLAAWATFAAAYGALVIVEPLFSWLVLRTLARVKGHAAVRFCFDLRLA